jgi:hypothetical protein
LRTPFTFSSSHLACGPSLYRGETITDGQCSHTCAEVLVDDADQQPEVLQQSTDLVLEVALHLDQEGAAVQKRTRRMTIQALDDAELQASSGEALKHLGATL